MHNDFLSRIQVTQQLRERIDKWYYMKLKIFCTTKESSLNWSSSPHNGRKIFVNYTSDKELVTGIYRELKKLNSPKINAPMRQQANELNRVFSKEEV
jgi:hypothetical protein